MVDDVTEFMFDNVMDRLADALSMVAKKEKRIDELCLLINQHEITIRDKSGEITGLKAELNTVLARINADVVPF